MERTLGLCSCIGLDVHIVKRLLTLHSRRKQSNPSLISSTGMLVLIKFKSTQSAFVSLWNKCLKNTNWSCCLIYSVISFGSVKEKTICLGVTDHSSSLFLFFSSYLNSMLPVKSQNDASCSDAYLLSTLVLHFCFGDLHTYSCLGTVQNTKYVKCKIISHCFLYMIHSVGE